MKPTDRLGVIIDNFTYTKITWPAFYRALADRTPDGYPGGGDTVRAGISDPTPGVVAARLGHTRPGPVAILDEINQLLGEAQAISNRVARLVASIREADKTSPDRCTGGLAVEGADDWGDPTCQRHAVTRDGLCDACRQRRDHWRRKEVA